MILKNWMDFEMDDYLSEVQEDMIHYLHIIRQWHEMKPRLNVYIPNDPYYTFERWLAKKIEDKSRELMEADPLDEYVA